MELVRSTGARVVVDLSDEPVVGYRERFRLASAALAAGARYVGADFEADMARMAADKITQEWWAVMVPLLQPLATRKPGELWASMEEVFHQD